MLLNVNFFLQYFFIIILIVIGILVLKFLIASMVTAILGFSFRIIVLVGLILSQIGEFSFILAATGIQYNLLSGSAYQIFISLSVLTMAITLF
jgi:CPA2 family monovalent cation:H+ antiporter-2